jgi:hypothetical protein
METAALKVPKVHQDHQETREKSLTTVGDWTNLVCLNPIYQLIAHIRLGM